MRAALGLVAGALLLAGSTTAFAQTPGATANVTMPNGQAVGTATFTQESGGVRIQGQSRGLPAGEHGIHVHAVGQCTPPFESAGPHWNPAQKKHGTQNPEGPHLGDMPNVTAGQDGSAHVAVSTPSGTLDSLMDADGASVVVHATADDYKTDPPGNSGARIACGVVTRR